MVQTNKLKEEQSRQQSSDIQKRRSDQNGGEADGCINAEEKMELEKKGGEEESEEMVTERTTLPPAVVASVIVPPAEQLAALEKVLPDFATHYEELFDIFGESLSSYLYTVPEPICESFI